MKRKLLGVLVPAIVFFIWQFLSWAAFGLHEVNLKYTPNQLEILDALEGQLEEGSYFLPNARPGATAEETEAFMKERTGKPWATVSYHRELNAGMGMNMLRGFATDLLIGFILFLIIVQAKGLDIKTGALLSIGIGLLGFASITYMNSIWFEENTIPDLIDAIVPWALSGIWLGWWLPKTEAN